MPKYIGCSPRARMGTGYRHRRSWPVLARSSGSQDPSVPVARPHRASPSSTICSGRCACGERKSRHDMVGFAKGMATTSGWTLVRFDCRNRINQVRQRRVARARRRWRPQPVHGGCDVKDRTRASIAQDAGDGNIFSRPWVQLRAGPSSSEGEHVRDYDIQAAIVPRTTCVSDQQTRSTTTRSEWGVVWICDTGAGDYHDGFPTGRHYRRRRGIGRSSSIRPRGAATTSPPEGVLRHMRHQELWRAVGTHYGPTRIYGPTGHAIGGTAQQALRSFYSSYHSQASALSVTTTGRQRPVGVWTSPPPPEPA
jgi:hypothetical protein